MSGEQLRVALEQTRARLESQKELADRIGDRAMKNIRLNLTIVGGFLSLIGIGSADVGGETIGAFATSVLNLASYSAGGAAVLSLFAGVAAYAPTANIAGFSVSDVQRAREIIPQEMEDREFFELLLRSHGDWIERNSQALWVDTTLLQASLVFIVVEIGCFAVSILAVLFELGTERVRQLVFVVIFLTLGATTGAYAIKEWTIGA